MKLQITLALAAFCGANAGPVTELPLDSVTIPSNNTGTPESSSIDTNKTLDIDSIDVESICHHNNPCPESRPVCNYDYGVVGFCEECPGHCINTGYINPEAVAVCCKICKYGKKGRKEGGCPQTDDGPGSETELSAEAYLAANPAPLANPSNGRFW